MSKPSARTVGIAAELAQQLRTAGLYGLAYESGDITIQGNPNFRLRVVDAGDRAAIEYQLFGATEFARLVEPANGFHWPDVTWKINEAAAESKSRWLDFVSGQEAASKQGADVVRRLGETYQVGGPPSGIAYELTQPEPGQVVVRYKVLLSGLDEAQAEAVLRHAASLGPHQGNG